jgi:hypothetical protein
MGTATHVRSFTDPYPFDAKHEMNRIQSLCPLGVGLFEVLKHTSENILLGLTAGKAKYSWLYKN